MAFRALSSYSQHFDQSRTSAITVAHQKKEVFLTKVETSPGLRIYSAGNLMARPLKKKKKARPLLFHLFVCLFLLVTLFVETGSSCRPGCPGTHYINQARLELTKSPRCLCPPNAMIRGKRDHTRPKNLSLIKYKFSLFHF